jgi:hypothetical protein
VPQTTTHPQSTDWPLYWFAQLERAVEWGDHQAAARAQRQLARLGVRVQYGRPRQATRDTGEEARRV